MRLKINARNRRFIPIAVLVICVISSFMLWHFSRRYFIAIEERRFDSRTNEITLRIVNKLNLNGAILRGGVGLFRASESVTRQEWHDYVEILQLAELYPGIQGVGFSKMISPSDLDSHIREVRAEGFPDYTVRPEGERGIYTSIIYLEPFDTRNRRAFGYDMFSEPVRQAAMERARDTGLVSMSGKVKLLQEFEKDVQAGFLLYAPLYKQNMPLNTIKERRSAIIGYVYSPLRMDDFINGIFKDGLQDIDLEIYDGTDVAEESLMYDNDRSVLYGPGQNSKRLFSAYKQIHINPHNGRKWTLRFTSMPLFEQSVNRYLPASIFAGSIIISIFFFLLTTAREITLNRSLELKEKNTELENMTAELGILNKELVLRRQDAEIAKLSADAANKAKSDFLANMSHELRTPLNSVIGFSEVLHDRLFGPLNDKQMEYVKEIIGSGTHLLSLISDILDLSKVETGKMELELNGFSLKDAINAALCMFREKAIRHDLKLNLEIESDADTEIEADERKLKQIMYNLLSNAMKFTKDGGAVRVTARRVNSEQLPPLSHPLPRVETGRPELIEISVADTGIGIKPEDMEKLFQPFSQLESAYTKKYEGTGLGLALTKRLVELHGGRLWAESEFGKGSRFTLVIPVRQDKDNAPKAEA